jgi:regulator of PEP synthase PpsR (kinase-PPPase family)
LANIPIIAEESMEPQFLRKLAPVEKGGVVGLVMLPEALASARCERAKFLGGGNVAAAGLDRYQEIDAIRDELSYCTALYRRLGIPTIDVTGRAIEEICDEILKIIGLPMSHGK